jgi:hypothetical protein
MGTWQGTGATDSPVVDKSKPPVYRERLTHLVTQNEHGNPVALPQERVGSRKANRRRCGQRRREKAKAVL